MSSFRWIAKHPTISLVECCSNLGEIKQIHTQLLINSLLNDPFVLGQFVASIALKHPNNLLYSNQVLDQCDSPTLFALNTMIRAFSKTPNPQKSFHFYHRILQSSPNLLPDNYTFTFLVRTCAQSLAPETGPAVHACVIRHGFDTDPHVQSGLIFMYSELGKVFDEIPDPDLVTQTAMLIACAKSGDVEFARELFDTMPRKDPIAWNAMIAGYMQRGKSREALDFFYSMQMEGVMVNGVSMDLLLSACAHLGALNQGRRADAYVERNKLQITVTLGTALVDMYAKCGNMNKAMEVFWGIK